MPRKRSPIGFKTTVDRRNFDKEQLRRSVEFPDKTDESYEGSGNPLRFGGLFFRVGGGGGRF